MNEPTNPTYAQMYGPDAAKYAISVQPATPKLSGYVWRCKSIRHIPVGENGMQHTVFVDAYDENGAPVRGRTDVQLGWGWLGQSAAQSAKPILFDKPENEPMANLPIFPKQRLNIWIVEPNVGNDIVTNLHTGFPDEGEDVRWGHHSYRVEFRKEYVYVNGEQPTVPAAPPAPTGPVMPTGTPTGLDTALGLLEQAVAILRELQAKG